MNLGDRILSAPLGTETLTDRFEIRLEDRLHTSNSDACTVRSIAVGIPRRLSLLLPGLGMRISRTGSGANVRDFS